MADVVVVGAGLAGLVATAELAGAGRRVLLLDAQSRAPRRAPAGGASSGLAGEGSDGFVDVDPLTLRHRTFPRVWALGDVATVDTSPSGGALRKQVPVVAHNIPAALVGKPLRH